MVDPHMELKKLNELHELYRSLFVEIAQPLQARFASPLHRAHISADLPRIRATVDEVQKP